MIPELIPVYLVIFLYGIVIGSFLNVCIYRIPKHETIVTERSHCMQCGYQLKWYDLIPIGSYLFLKGRCRKCGCALSAQYPLVEFFNGVLYVIVFAVTGFRMESVLISLLGSALLVLSVIDWRSYEIPVGINGVILCLGAGNLLLHRENWSEYVIGFFVISAFLYILLLVSNGRAIGGGDVKLMAAAGLFLGWKFIILAFVLACVTGSICHLIRMRVSHVGKVLAMGPYLSIGIMVVALFGQQILEWYMNIVLG